MNVKTLTTVGLLLFVGAGVVTLIVKESSAGAKSPEASMATQNSGAETTTNPSTTPASDSAAVESQERPEAISQTIEEAAQTAKAQDKVVVYYFHAQKRCMTCNRIETLAHTAVDSHFSAAVEEGLVEWKTVNLDEAGNRRYIQDFKLSMPTVVMEIVDPKGGTKEFKSLDRIWQLVRNDAAFDTYIREEMEAYLDKIGNGADNADGEAGATL